MKIYICPHPATQGGHKQTKASEALCNQQLYNSENPPSNNGYNRKVTNNIVCINKINVYISQKYSSLTKVWTSKI